MAPVVERIIHHVFLPPRLPQESDEASELAILHMTAAAIESLQNDNTSMHPTALNNVLNLLNNTKAVNRMPNGGACEVQLRRCLVHLQDCETVAIKIAEQNAAVLISRSKDTLIFEQFELSPQNEHVMGTAGRLIRVFPTTAIQIKHSMLQEADFATTVAETLSTMSQEPVEGMQPQSKKAGESHDETRDTTHPGIVSELFFSFLKGAGGTPTKVTAISKNTRDEVLWQDAEEPWRRSPMWLLLRVALQLVIERSKDGSRTLYKKVMAHIMGHILEAARKHGVSSDLLYAMNAKLARRLTKLEHTGRVTSSLIDGVRDSLHLSMATLETRWEKLQQQNARSASLSPLADLDFASDSSLSLPDLGKYLQGLASRTRTSDDACNFVPTHLVEHENSSLPELSWTTSPDFSFAVANLQEFEQWVVRYLDQWIMNYGCHDICEKLHMTVKRYHELANSLYDGNPEAQSIMILTIFEIWIACDQAAIKKCPMLGEYDFQIPGTCLDNLLLPFRSHMKRLAKVEEYLDRRSQPPLSAQGMFSISNSHNFASRYFDQSPKHKALRLNIESTAEREKAAKLVEFRQKKAEYERLNTLHNQATCEYRTITVYDCWGQPDGTKEQHESGCRKCSYQQQRDSISLVIFEWPLPSRNTNANTVVFELEVPDWFTSWRDLRLYVLRDVLKGHRDQASLSADYRISNDPHLKRRFIRGPSNRTTLLSESKPQINTHYGKKNMAKLTEDKVCVANGLQYDYFDADNGSWLRSPPLFPHTIQTACTYKLPPEMKSLQKYLFRPRTAPDGPNDNEVIAGQNSCPLDMSLEEYKYLCNIPLGRHLQWLNIQVQLAMPSVDFKKPETMLFVLQCIYQAGPAGEEHIFRGSHRFLAEDNNAVHLIKSLDSALQRVKENWESAQSLLIFISIATRVLSLTQVPSTQAICLSFLDSARDIGFRWLHLVREKAHGTTELQDRTSFLHKSAEIAMICASTFDVEEHFLPRLLDADNTATLIKCSIVVQEVHGESSAGGLTRLLHHRFARLLHRSYSLLSHNQAGIHAAVKSSWSGYIPQNEWRKVSDKAGHWLTTTSNNMPVHLNLLNGELLVKGLPLDQPPRNYRELSLFKTLFGDAVVEVMPTESPGFSFSTKREFESQRVELGLSSGRLLVRASSENNSYELVPRDLFVQELPEHFVNDYVQWYDNTSGNVQFRPAEAPWTLSSSAHWLLCRNNRGWQLRKDDLLLLGLRSQTSSCIAGILEPLVDPTRVHTILQPSRTEVEIDIPTLKLGFCLSEGTSSLRSKEYRGMHVDPEQALGTLVGFYNKLLLRSSSGERAVLLPEAQVSYQKAGGHVTVSVAKRLTSRVHRIDVDACLGRLKDSGSLDCKLLLAYLHALTSFCLPDPLTCKTGTEQALFILESAAVRSFSQLSQSNVDLLHQIAQLSPRRSFYPKHLRSMQSVNWDNHLHPLSQHGKLCTVVQSLLDQANRCEIFFPQSQLKIPVVGSSDAHLLRRDRLRTSTFRTHGYGAEDFDTSWDAHYKGRDYQKEGQRAVNAGIIATLACRGGDALCQNSLAISWQSVSNLSEVFGPENYVESQYLKYSAYWTGEWHEYVWKRLPSLHRLLQDPDISAKKFSLGIWLATMSFSSVADFSLQQMLVMFMKTAGASDALAPSVPRFFPQQGKTCSKATLESVLKQHEVSFRRCPEFSLTRDPGENDRNYNRRRQQAHSVKLSGEITSIAEALMKQWPCAVPSVPDRSQTHVSINKAMDSVREHFKQWYANKLLSDYLDAIEEAIRDLPVQPVILASLGCSTADRNVSQVGYISVQDVFSVTAPQLQQGRPVLQDPAPRHIARVTATDRLESVIETMQARASSKFEQDYVADLLHSLKALGDCPEVLATSIAESDLIDHLGRCESHLDQLQSLLLGALQIPSSAGCLTKQWPRLSPLLLLQQLGRARWCSLSEDWKSCIIEYGLALTALQRAARLVKLADRPDDLTKELQNAGHSNWDPFEHPETLLIEVDAGILVRPNQEEIAGQMRAPESQSNAVMQLNMGEGKSSVILPIVAADLADASRLVRVIVAKPQAQQMAQMLVDKLGGLADRRVYFMPFSRSLRPTPDQAGQIADMCRECMSNGGILLVQPEHILSFQLMAPECYITDKDAVGQSLRLTQDFLDTFSRDLVDEADTNFDPRFELVYTMGTQTTIELSPDRWFILQQVMDLIPKHVPGLINEDPSSLEDVPGPKGSFSRLRVIRPAAGQALIDILAGDICEHGIGSLQLARQPPAIRKAILVYLTRPILDEADIEAVENGPYWNETSQGPLLLLRGLFAGGILQFVLGQKRWRVNYGLADRSPPTGLAVPYRAKDSPSLRSEFSHPDVVIALTTLCYYYAGLSDDQLFTALEHLLESDQPDAEYQAWVECSNNLPSAFHQLQGINVKDRQQCKTDIFPCLHRGKAVCDYFLSHIIFPKEMKEFPHKLSASGWDIGRKKDQYVTGFSGTNDSRCLLPIDVNHLDLAEQKHTNALVLEFILRPENGICLLDRDPSGGQQATDAERFLSKVIRQVPPIQVILDVGAQILEMTNIQVAKRWLELQDEKHKEAVIFVNDNDELRVVDRKGRAEPFYTSSYAARPDLCLVFLDEAHTRGIDLKLPANYRAAVTLGAKTTKDTLVQGCMRMRKLGKGQSVLFCVSEEIQGNIRDLSGLSTSITVPDVLLWVISETYAEVRRNMPLWLVQGERYTGQRKLWDQAEEDGHITLSKAYAEKFLEREAQTIDNRYRPRLSTGEVLRSATTADPYLNRILAKAQDFQNLDISAGTLQEEQERELSPEIVQERQTQRAPPADPVLHRLHQHVVDFAVSGSFHPGSSSYMPAFQSLRDISAAKAFDATQLRAGGKLWVTADFAATIVKRGASYFSDAFERWAQWVLINRVKGTDAADHMLLISPYEANLLYERVKSSRGASLHLYKPRVNSGYDPIDGLDFHVVSGLSEPPIIPRALIVQLNVFAGQLYISSYEDYVEICNFLGFSHQIMTKQMEDDGWKIGADGFILQDGNGKAGAESGVQKSPAQFLKVLMSKIRRHGGGIGKTHMGDLLNGKLLQESDFGSEGGSSVHTTVGARSGGKCVEM